MSTLIPTKNIISKRNEERNAGSEKYFYRFWKTFLEL